MRFKVPQNVQREDTIIGPITLKQMGILGGGGSIAYVIYISLAKQYYTEVWLPPVLIVVLITLAFTFLKVHNMSFTKYLLRQIEYKFTPRKKIWQKGADTLNYIPKLEKITKSKEKYIEKKENKSFEELSKMLDQK